VPKTLETRAGTAAVVLYSCTPLIARIASSEWRCGALCKCKRSSNRRARSKSQSSVVAHMHSARRERERETEGGSGEAQQREEVDSYQSKQVLEDTE
jgi:hypothetical protein